MADYTVLDKKDIDKINEYYDLSIDEFTPMLGGAGNSSFFCNAKNENFVVTVCDEKTYSEVENLGKLLLHLEKNNFPTTQIISPIDGKSPIMLLLDKPVLVKRFIPGEVIQVLNNEMLFHAGAMMANLHKIPAPAYLNKEHPYGKQFFSSVVGKNIDKKYENWLEKRVGFLNQSISENLPTSLIHGDLFFDNILFKDDKLNAFIDFEEACHYYRVFDIGMGIVGLTTENEEVNLAKAKNFLQGYQDVTRLEEIEKMSLKLFIEYAAMATSYWQYCNYNIYNPTEEMGDKHLGMMTIAINVNSIPDDVFISRVY